MRMVSASISDSNATRRQSSAPLDAVEHELRSKRIAKEASGRGQRERERERKKRIRLLLKDLFGMPRGSSWSQLSLNLHSTLQHPKQRGMASRTECV